MYLNLTNNSGIELPIMSADEGGWVKTLPPGQSTALSHVDSDVVIIGNKPSVSEQIAQGVKTIAKTVAAVLRAWQDHNSAQPTAADSTVRVAIENTGEKAVRVILGDGVNDYQVQPGETYQASAWGYLELRELGDVQADPNQHEAA